MTNDIAKSNAPLVAELFDKMKKGGWYGKKSSNGATAPASSQRAHRCNRKSIATPPQRTH